MSERTRRVRARIERLLQKKGCPRLVMALVLGLAPACSPTGFAEPRSGDLIFHRSLSSQSEALRRAMGSPYTHMGVVFVGAEGPVVLEAVGPVKWTPLAEWVRRGEDGHFIIKRLRDASRLLTPDAIEKLRTAGEAHLGRPYDIYFEWSDKRIYCSELAWKMYRDALGVEIGKRQRFVDFDLSDPLVASKLRERFGDHVPLDEPVISPAAMFESDMLVTVVER